MNHSWQRGLGALAGIGVALLLAGCEIAGTVDVRSETEVVADFTITHAEPDCLGLEEFRGLVVRGTPDSSGNQVCRAQGTIDLNEFEDVGLKVSRVGEYLVLDLAVPERIGYAPLDVTVSFPGLVVEAGGGRATGNQVTIGPGMGITSASGTRLVALAHPGPEWWVVGVLAGLICGAALTLAGFWYRRRRRAARPAAADPAQAGGVPTSGILPAGTGTEPEQSAPASAVPGPAGEPRDVRAPAGDPGRGRAPDHSGEGGQASDAGHPGDDGQWSDPGHPQDRGYLNEPGYAARFAPPPGHRAAERQPRPTIAPAELPIPASSPEHLVWAPPDERGPGEPTARNGSGPGPID